MHAKIRQLTDLLKCHGRIIGGPNVTQSKNGHLIIVDSDDVTVDFVRIIRTVFQDVAPVVHGDAATVVAGELVVRTLTKGDDW